MHPSGVQRAAKASRVLTGGRFPAEPLRDTKTVVEACTCIDHQTLEEYFGVR